MNAPAIAVRGWSGQRTGRAWPTRARAYLASDQTRAIQSALGLLWIIDGALQFQPFMYSSSWTAQLASMELGQPQWLAASIGWGTDLAAAHLAVWNSLFALTQLALGFGLLYRRTVKAALATSLIWTLIVWWLGEAFGLLFMNTANPLTGAPGAVLLYGLIGLLVWPDRRPGGLLGERGARSMWVGLWVVMAWLWLLPANSGDNSVSNAIAAAPTGAAWLSTLLAHAAHLTQGHGEPIAVVCAGLSLLIGSAVGLRWHPRVFLAAAIAMNMLYWVFGQALGGIATGNATDVNTAPLFVLLACAMATLSPARRPAAVTGPGINERAQPEQPLATVAFGRRAVLTALGLAGGLAGVAVLAELASKLGRGGGHGSPDQPPGGLGPHGENHGNDSHGNNSHGNGTHGNGSHGNSSTGSQATDPRGRSDPNSGIQMLGSQLALPAQFRSPLPIPVQLQPSRQSGDTDYYTIVQSAATAEIIPGKKTPIWGYNGTFPGPTIVQRPGRQVVVTHHNALPVPTVVHLHGGTTPHDSDGYPTDFVLPAASYGPFPVMPAMNGMPAMTDPDAVMTRLTRDYVYPSQPRAATLWYHDHRMDFTGASVYRGLAGFHIAQDSAEQALPLPRGARDLPLMIADRAFAADGTFLYPSLDPTLRSIAGVDKSSMNGVMGDVILVNGAPWPVLNVDTARYQFRILNASNARTYQLALQTSSGTGGFTQIGTDHGLLAAPLALDTITIAPAQRFDVVIDFSRRKVGDQVTLVDQLGSGSTAAIMRFTVSKNVTDTSSVPATLSPKSAITPTSGMRRRTMKFHKGANDWTINGQVFDPTVSQADVPAGSTEVWTITSDFHHPFHIHNATMQVLTRDKQAPGPDDQGWKDTVFVNLAEQVELAIRFSNDKGRYVFHCHNLEHEDMGMMANFRII